ncbi:MAG: hypothetical protein J5522_08385 [Lachnospiraceae bacterium]|nr:hypothetical protein [Lachnospiraceae bacterium]MBR4815800.1 hypothetical protein [Lachnospiraceae bacterium]
MKKGKRIAAIVLTIVMVTVTNVCVKANSSEHGALGDYTVYAQSHISTYSAYGTTYSSLYNPDILAEVTYAEYICIKPYTTNTTTLTGSSWGYSTTTKTFSAPDGYRSSSIACDHKASLGSGTWTNHTNAAY